MLCCSVQISDRDPKVRMNNKIITGRELEFIIPSRDGIWDNKNVNSYAEFISKM